VRAEQGDAEAQFDLGFMYDVGHTDALNLLGYMYRDGGEGVPAD
jgi:TPR repeat protein